MYFQGLSIIWFFILHYYKNIYKYLCNENGQHGNNVLLLKRQTKLNYTHTKDSYCINLARQLALRNNEHSLTFLLDEKRRTLCYLICHYPLIQFKNPHIKFFMFHNLIHFLIKIKFSQGHIFISLRNLQSLTLYCFHQDV